MHHTHSAHTVGRILFGLPLIVFGIMHFTKLEGMTGMVPGFAPGDSFWVVLTGIVLIVAGVGIVAQKFTREAAMLAALFLALTVLFVHLPNYQSNMPNLLKDLALLGGALMLLSRYPKHSNE